jgi:hypothetical protein
MNTEGEAVAHGLNFLDAEQQANGSFISETSGRSTPFTAVRSYHTTFVPSLILAALATVDTAEALTIRRRLANWLVKQKSPEWSFNYWAKGTGERKRLPYPDDLDDTFCALIGLRQHDPSIIDGACLAKVVRLLVATESQVGGPYHTWLVDSNAPDVWHDIDLAVNSNIAYFLSLVAEPLPNLTALMEQAILTGKFTSPYYPSWQPLVYFLARAYQGPHQQRLIQFLLAKRRHGHWGNPLNTALAVSSLVRLGHVDGLAPAIAYLRRHQQSDGSWPVAAFCLDPAQKGKTHYHGSATLTTALVIEALTLYAAAQEPPQLPRRKGVAHTAGRDEDQFYQHIMSTGRHQLHNLDKTLRQAALTRLEAMQKNRDSREIALLPLWFSRSLRTPPRLDSDILTHLGLANVFGWMAYTIYDDFLDDEGDPALLSVANAALRYSLVNFHTALPTNTAFHTKVQQAFDRIDGANAWEVAHCRFKLAGEQLTIGNLPVYGRAEHLAERSIGHALTPLGVLAASGLALDSPAAKSIEGAFVHYLSARQLNDDAHDWEEDLRRGHSTYVVTAVLKALDITHTTLPLDTLLPRVQQHFWEQALPRLCQVMKRQTVLAGRAAARSQLLTEHNVLTEVVDGIDQVISHTLHEHAKAINFLSAYRA